jgi:hypothetical protein
MISQEAWAIGFGLMSADIVILSCQLYMLKASGWYIVTAVGGVLGAAAVSSLFLLKAVQLHKRRRQP